MRRGGAGAISPSRGGSDGKSLLDLDVPVDLGPGGARRVRQARGPGQYAKLAGPAILGAGGQFLARGGKVAAYEAGVAERTVVVEFESFDQAVAAHDSEAYQAALKKLEGAVVRDLRIVEGVD